MQLCIKKKKAMVFLLQGISKMKGRIIQGIDKSSMKKVEFSLGNVLRDKNQKERQKKINKEISRLLDGY